MGGHLRHLLNSTITENVWCLRVYVDTRVREKKHETRGIYFCRLIHHGFKLLWPPLTTSGLIFVLDTICILSSNLNFSFLILNIYFSNFLNI